MSLPGEGKGFNRQFGTGKGSKKGRSKGGEVTRVKATAPFWPTWFFPRLTTPVGPQNNPGHPISACLHSPWKQPGG